MSTSDVALRLKLKNAPRAIRHDEAHRPPATGSMTREIAHDVVEAAQLAGGTAHAYGPMASGAWGVAIGNLPDVALFMRGLRLLGVQGTITYNAGTGWKVTDA